MEYPIKLLPKTSYKSIETGLEDKCLIRHFVLDENQGAIDDLGFLKDYIIASGGEKQLPDLSTSLYGIFTEDDINFNVVNAQLTEYCEPNHNSTSPIYLQDFNITENSDKTTITNNSFRVTNETSEVKYTIKYVGANSGVGYTNTSAYFKSYAEGGKEIVLTGVNIGDFGKTTGESFFDLVKALDQVEGIERYRISSIEPNLLTDAIIEFVSHSRSFMPHFHIPLQSGCDEVLQLMRRRYDTALFASKVRKIKEVMPDAFIGVDVIVGTRGETPEYFEQAYQFIDGLDVTQLHVFSYSERPGTQALKIEYVVSPEEKHQRSQRLLTLSDQKTQAFYARHIGQVMPVLMEKSKTGVPMHGFTENYIRVEVENDDSLDNRVVNVRLGDFNEERTALKSTILI